jgi:hypothetical protein
MKLRCAINTMLWRLRYIRIPITDMRPGDVGWTGARTLTCPVSDGLQYHCLVKTRHGTVIQQWYGKHGTVTVRRLRVPNWLRDWGVGSWWPFELVNRMTGEVWHS